MTPSQTEAIERIRNFIGEQLNKTERYQDTVVEFTVTENKWFASVVVRTDMLGLVENNMLRILSGQWWHFFIGKRGKITVKNCPKYYRQFDGKTAFDMSFDL